MNLKQLTLFELPEVANHKVSDEDVIKAYNRFVKAYYETEPPMEKPNPKMTKEMGYISNVKDARKSLENIFKNS